MECRFSLNNVVEYLILVVSVLKMMMFRRKPCLNVCINFSESCLSVYTLFRFKIMLSLLLLTVFSIDSGFTVR